MIISGVFLGIFGPKRSHHAMDVSSGLKPSLAARCRLAACVPLVQCRLADISEAVADELEHIAGRL